MNWRLVTDYTLVFDKHRFVNTSHGPKSWKWWQLFHIHIVRAASNTVSWNIWIYTRWGSWGHGWYPRKEGTK